MGPGRDIPDHQADPVSLVGWRVWESRGERGSTTRAASQDPLDAFDRSVLRPRARRWRPDLRVAGSPLEDGEEKETTARPTSCLWSHQSSLKTQVSWWRWASPPNVHT